MEKKAMRLSYDPDADVLYMSFGPPQFGLDEEGEAGIFIRRHPEHKHIIGATVMDFQKRFSKKLEEVLPITLEDIDQIPA